MDGDHSGLGAVSTNLRERIVFCVDFSKELEDDSADNCSALHHVINCLKSFVAVKSSMNSAHEYALLGYQGTSFWFLDYSNNSKEVIQNIEEFGKTDCEEHLESDIGLIFSEISRAASRDSAFLQAHSVLRMIMIYSSTQVMPSCSIYPQNLTAASNFFLDVVFVHRETDSETEKRPQNRTQRVYDELINIAENFSTVDGSYFYPVSQGVNLSFALRNAFTQLVGHPSQRCIQLNVNKNGWNPFL
eukprot:CFRG4905T1